MKRLTTLIAALAWLWASPVLAAPAVIGSANDHSSAQTSIVVTTTADCPVGAIAIGVGGTLVATNPPTSATDNSVGGPNTWNIGTAQNVGSGDAEVAWIWSKITHDLASGKTITVSMASTTFRFATFICTQDFTFAASPLDINGAGATGISTTPSFTTGTLAQTSEQAFGYVMQGNPAITLTEDSNWTNIENYSGNSSANFTVNIAFRNTAATTALTYAPTTGAQTARWGDNILTFKQQVATVSCTLGLLGVGC